MNDTPIEPNFFQILVDQHRDAHDVIETAIIRFAQENWENVGSRDPKPDWSPILWLEGWDVVDTEMGPIIHAAFLGEEEGDQSILAFPVSWLDFYPGAVPYVGEAEAPAGRKVGHLTVIK